MSHSIFGFYKDLKTIYKIIILVLTMAVFMIAMSFVGYHFNEKANHSLNVIYHNNLEPIKWISLFRINVNANRANLLAMILEDSKEVKDKYLNDIQERTKASDELLAEFKKSMEEIDNTFALDELKALDGHLEEYIEIKQEIINFAMENKKEKAFKVFKDNARHAQDLFDSVAKLSTNIQERAEHRNEQAKQDQVFANTAMLITIIVAIIFSLGLGVIIAFEIQSLINKLINRMQEVANGNLKVEDFGHVSNSDLGMLCKAFDGMNSILKKLDQLVLDTSSAVNNISTSSDEMAIITNETVKAVQQISLTISQLSEGAQDQSTSIANSVENLENINVLIKNIQENAKNSVNSSSSAEKNAEEGFKKAELAVEKINIIKVKANEVSGIINKLEGLSSNIEQIVELIKNIAAQTNLLALNAAIEAARAGDHGKGFAVVAEEVKKLADDCASATDNITDMIKQVQQNTSSAVITMNDAVENVVDGVEIVEHTGENLRQILTIVKDSNNQALGISSDVETLSSSSEKLYEMMENISSVIEESTASTEEISAMTEEQTASMENFSQNVDNLAGIAEELNKQLASFKV